MSLSPDEPLIPPRLRRPLVAAWISLGVHAGLIALIQVAPPAPVKLAEPAIEVRLVQAHATPVAETGAAQAPATEPPREPPQPRLAPSVPAEAPPVAVPREPPPLPRPEAAESGPPAEPQLDESSPAPPAAWPSPDAAAAPAAAITSAVDLTYYDARELDVQPRALHEIVPAYPADADRRRLSGKVRVRLELEADGRISDVAVVSATPPGVFEDSAVKALRHARFAPAQRNGRPVRARVLIDVLYDWERRARNP